MRSATRPNCLRCCWWRSFAAPLPIIAGIAVATLASHAAAAALGHWLMTLLEPRTLRWLLGLSFLAVAAWMLVPDKADERAPRTAGHWGVFGITTLAFFIAEMGDKTQVATVMLAARFDALTAVVAGTTLGMLLANVPAVLFGDKLMQRLPVQWVHRIAAIVFALLGVLALVGLGR